MAVSSYDILSIQERSDKRRNAGYDVINGCAGMLFEEDKSLCIFDEVNKKIETSFRDYLSYPQVLGSDSYKDGVLSWLFEDLKKDIEDKNIISFCTTIGGTGAVHFAFKEYGREKAVALLPDIRWPNYDTLAKECLIDTEIYRMLNDKGELDFSSLKNRIDSLLEAGKKILLVVNDPCQNPLGYCMSKEEYVSLISLLESYKGKVDLLLDIAYVDYCDKGFLFAKEIQGKNLSFETHLVFSASKAFSLYGMRLGALISLVHSRERKEFLERTFTTMARGTYSCPNNTAMGPLALFFNDEEGKKNVKEKITAEKKRLLSIGKGLEKVLDSAGIKHFPYKGGFYLTFIKKKAFDFCGELEKKDIFFAPIDDDHVRVAVSALSTSDIEKLGERLR